MGLEMLVLSLSVQFVAGYAPVMVDQVRGWFDGLNDFGERTVHRRYDHIKE